MSLSLLLSCGEPSGDMYAGALTREILTLSPGADVAGLGGPEFARAGGRILVDYRGLSVTGFAAIVAKLPQLHRARRLLVAEARASRPAALVVIDYFGFNGRLARDCRALGIPIVYYVSPQIWAWRPGRIKLIREVVNRMLVIFPFEEPLYRAAGVPVEFVGHPLVDLAMPSATREEFLRRHGLDPSAPVVALLPGSRSSELRRLFPTIVGAARRLRQAVPSVQFVVARAPNLENRLFAPAASLAGVVIVETETDDAIAAADIVITASGTATVQVAMHDKPMVVVYRVSSLEYMLARPFVRVDTFAMVNLILGTRLVPELIQGDFTVEAVAREALSLLTDNERAARIRQGLADVRRRLGGSGGSRRAALAILRTIGETCPTAS